MQRDDGLNVVLVEANGMDPCGVDCKVWMEGGWQRDGGE